MGQRRAGAIQARGYGWRSCWWRGKEATRAEEEAEGAPPPHVSQHGHWRHTPQRSPRMKQQNPSLLGELGPCMCALCPAPQQQPWLLNQVHQQLLGLSSKPLPGGWPGRQASHLSHRSRSTAPDMKLAPRGCCSRHPPASCFKGPNSDQPCEAQMQEAWGDQK